MQKSPTEVDRQVGARIAHLRKAAGLSQNALGTAIGVTFQQVQKYETGRNRIGAGRLTEIAKLLGVPAATLLGQSDGGDQGGLVAILAEPGAAELLRTYAAIAEPTLRLALRNTAHAFARATAPAEAA